METHAFGFRLPANAPEGQKRFPISQFQQRPHPGRIALALEPEAHGHGGPMGDEEEEDPHDVEEHDPGIEIHDAPPSVSGK